MSINLVFKTKVGNHQVEFPYQTKTEVTNAVMSKLYPAARLQILKDDLKKIVDLDDATDREWYDNKISDLKSMLESDSLVLSTT